MICCCYWFVQTAPQLNTDLHTLLAGCDELSAGCQKGLTDNSNRANYKTVFPIVWGHSILDSRRIVGERGKLLCFMRRRHWPTQQIHPVDWITSLKLKPIEFKWNTKKPESDCRASRYLKDNDKLKTGICYNIVFITF